MDDRAYQQFADLERTHWWFRSRRRIFFHLLDNVLPRDRAIRALDVGCGAGGFLPGLDRYGTPIGLETHGATARTAAGRTQLPIIRADAYHTPLSDDALDAVCLFDALEHMPDEQRVLSEVHRILRPGGIAFFSVPAYQFLYANNDRVANHCRRYTRRRLRRVLTDAGFEPVKITYFNALLFPLILPAVLLQKLRERFVGLPDPEWTNLTVTVPGPLSKLLYGVMSSERHWLARASFPFGHSLIAIVRKADAETNPIAASGEHSAHSRSAPRAGSVATAKSVG